MVVGVFNQSTTQQRQMNFYEFDANLIYLVNCELVMATS